MKNATKRKRLNKDISKYVAVFDDTTKLLAEHTKPAVALISTLTKTGCLDDNFCLLTDSYKIGHWLMLPDDVEAVYSYFESRKGAKFPFTVLSCLQVILQKYFVGVVITKEDIDEAQLLCKEHFGIDVFNRKMWEYIVNECGGKLPLRIKAAPEGLPVPIGNVLVTVENTGGKITAPLTNVIETILTHIWYPSNVATISRDLKNYLRQAFTVSADTETLLPFMMHDFGFRGATCVEAAKIGGAGHLINFMGTDTLPALTTIKRFYYYTGMPGYSVLASEHSVMTAKGKAGELEVFRRLIRKFPKGILSIVADSYNIKRVVEEYLPLLKDDIMARDGKVVIRPDSRRHKGDTAAEQVLWLANSLGNLFGFGFNGKGYKVLNSHIGIIYGDGLSADEIKECIKTLVLAGWSAETCVYGMGGGLLQKHNRDTQRSAFKCSAQLQSGKWVDIQKDPMDETKRSKAGRLKLVWDGKTLITVPESDPRPDVLVTVFENGELVKKWKFEEIRANAETVIELYK